MSVINQINNIDLELILQKLQIRYRKKGNVLELYDKGEITGGWKGDINKGIISDFSEKGRANGDRIDFIAKYFGVDRKRSIKWYIDNFNIMVDKKKPISNPIEEKWNSLPLLSNVQKEYLASRFIDADKLELKDLGGYIALYIRGLDGNIKSIQSRNITEEGPRYKVLANTDSDGLFYYGIKPELGYLIVVEGMTDFLSLRQYTTNVVGLVNAKNQGGIEIIKAMSTKYDIFFVPDNDEAGKSTIQKFQERLIRYNYFNLDIYGCKDINEVLCNYGLGEEILDVIFAESEKPLSNLRLALNKAKIYKKLYEENGGMLGFSSGYKELDKYISGIILGKSYLIMAYSNQGKSRFAYSLIKHMIKLKKKIVFFSLEVDVGMLFLEIIGAITQKTKEEILSNLEATDIKEIEKYLEVYDDIRSLEQIQNKILNSNADVVFIDFVQNIEHKGDEYSKMTDIAIQLQKSGILTGKTLINLSQVNNESRFAEGTNIQPKGSGALFASSDVIFSLWAKDNHRYLTIAKNKYGPAGINFSLNIDFKTSTFILFDDNPQINQTGVVSTYKRAT